MLLKNPPARSTLATLLFAAAFAALPPLTYGQAANSAPANATASATDKSDSDVVMLSPFTVTSEEDHGYAATATLAGTRLRTDLKDLGAAISVVTKDFLNDTGITGNGTLLTYTTNTEVGGVHGNYAGFGTGTGINENRITPQTTTRIRGLDNADNTRDYFLTNIPWDSYNIDRVDTVRGPNSILYGLGSPAGIVNTSINEARFSNKTVVEARYGRFGSYRGSVDANMVLLPKELSLRFDTVYSSTQFEQKPAFNHDFRQFGALRFDPSVLNNSDRMTTTIKLAFEHGKILSNNPTTSPPTDNITPWFDPSKGNKFTTDPLVTNNANLQGPTWTFHGIVTDYSPNAGSGNGVSNQANGSPNPFYNPWVGVPFQSGTTLLTGVAPFTPHGLTFLQPSLSLGNTPSVIGKAINGIAYNQFAGVNSYAGWVQNAKLPGYSTGLYKDRYVYDPSVFDYYNKLIGGENSRQWQNWTSFNTSLSQTFLASHLGYEAAFHQESYHKGEWNVFGGNGDIQLWTQTFTIDGTPDANFGKPYITGAGQYGNDSFDSKSTDVRVTAFGELRGSDIFSPGSKAASIVGRQRLTGLYSTYNHEEESRNWMLYATDPNYDQTYLNNPAQQVNLTSYAPHIVSFLSGSVANATTISGANLPFASTVSVPTDGTINQFIPKWTAPSTLDPNGVWTPPTGQPGAINADNPANYQGWSTVPVHVFNAFNGNDINNLYTGGNKREVVVSSKAAIWQGWFFDGLVVPLVGLRKDTVRTASAQPNKRSDGTYNLSDPSYQLGPQTVESGTTKTYSLVVHLPERIKSKLPLGLDFSAYYSQSENFQPGQGRVDVYGAALANPSGKTKDYGLVVSALEGKITLKVNKFETKILNANSGLDNTWYIGQGLERGYVFDQFFKNNYGQDWQNHFQPNLPGQTQAQATALQGPAVAAWDTFMQDADVQKVFKVWKLQSTGPTAWQTNQLTSTTPVGYSTTQDNVSKGYEFELSTQVNKNWTLTANASKSTATVTNVGGSALAQWVNKYNSFMQGPGGDIRLWWGGGPNIRDDWNTFLAPWSKGQIGADSDVSELRPWAYNVITNYRFTDGVLKGLNAGGAYRWQSRDIIGYPTTLDSAGAFHFDLKNPWHGPSTSGLDLWTGYDFKASKGVKWHLQFNLRNVLANKKLIPVNRQYDGSIAAVRIPEPIGFEFTSRLEF